MKLKSTQTSNLTLNHHPHMFPLPLPLPVPPPETTKTNHNVVEEQTEPIKTDISTNYMKVIKEECNSSSSSSIGNNSDDDDVDKDREDDAQSPYRYDRDDRVTSNGSLDDAIQSLEAALPIRRGISTFYDGKSKSFTCLANMWRSTTPSINDIAKPDNAFSRKRRNLLASTILSHNNNRVFQLSNINTGRISKKPKTATFHFDLGKDDTDIKSPNLSSMRSFSMVNLHKCSSRFGLKSTEIENC